MPPTSSPPVITLTTDFGLSDHFVGTMKGVILSICPSVEIIDITHEIGAFEIAEGAYTISQAYKYFPKKTIHTVVVDPGVGTSRRPLLAKIDGHYFVAPDNGVLSMIFSQHEETAAHEVRFITAAKYFLKEISNTFHGRDIFAPVSAHLANGVPAARFGKVITDFLTLDLAKPGRTGKRTWTGTILKVDRFGNLITNFHLDQFDAVRTGKFELRVGLEKVSRLALNYSESPFGEVFVITGSSGYLEVAVSQGSAAKLLGCGPGAPAELTLY